MGFSRKDIYGTSPLDIKNLNDNLKYIWKKVFGGISSGDLMPGSVNKKILSKDLQKEISNNTNEITNVKSNMEQTDKEVEDIIGQINDINTKKVSTEHFESTITQLSNAILDRVTSSEFSSYKLQTDKKIASKVSSGDFTSYKEQTDKHIDSIVESYGVINTLISQTNDRIDLVVRGNSIDGDAIVSAINMSSSRIKMKALNIDLDGYVTISDLEHGRTEIDGSCIRTGTIDSRRIDTEDLFSNITKVSRYVIVDGGRTSSVNGIGTKQRGDGKGYLQLMSSAGVMISKPCVDEDMNAFVTEDWVRQYVQEKLESWR